MHNSTVSWWFPSSDWTLTELVPADTATVRNFYTDVANLKLVHPLILTVRKVGPEHWRVQERNPLGPLSFRVWYSTHVHVEANGDVVGESRLFLGVRLHDIVSFESVDGGTQVIERLRIVAPRPLAAYTHREAVKAHEEMLGAMRRHFEQLGEPRHRDELAP
ncbi:hypothetical protein AWC16_00850 [Mycolicibacter longobardus]|uniref:Polyketide cyclase / dehydrase and lipid transport n=1 Tax=Mycolicibacter longobardus TaxID=1108812 RepID=A0A1X1Y6Q7_9MYCO|nr:hypothetical protein AWC16_00850 [Mycolicibacter longobardus]